MLSALAFSVVAVSFLVSRLSFSEVLNLLNETVKFPREIVASSNFLLNEVVITTCFSVASV